MYHWQGFELFRVWVGQDIVPQLGESESPCTSRVSNESPGRRGYEPAEMSQPPVLRLLGY